MRKLLLITLTAIICLFTTEFQNIANAEVLQPFYYDSNFASDIMPTNQTDKELSDIVLKFRYADAILISNVNSYIKLLNVQADPSFNNIEAQKILNNLNTDEANLTLTNKATYSLVYIIYYQKKYMGQITRQLSLFTDSQRKQYSAICYNINMVSRLYNVASGKLETLISDNPYNPKLAKMSLVVAGLNVEEDLAYKIFDDMNILGTSYIPDLVNPSFGVNTPKTANTLHDKEQTATITINLVQASEAEARKNYSNILASASAKPKNDDEYFYWETKGLEYKVNRQYKEALECFTKAINLNPSKGEVWSSRGRMKNVLGDYNGAIYDYSQSIKLGYNVQQNYYSRAFSKILSKQDKGAIEDFKKAYALTDRTKQDGIAIMSEVYAEQLQKGKGDFLRKAIKNPYFLVDEYIKENGAMSLYEDPFNLSSAKTVPQSIQKQSQSKAQPKSVCPIGCRVYMIIGRLKDSHTEVRYTAIAPINKIEDIVNADPRFEWVRYETVPDSYLDRYPRY